MTRLIAVLLFSFFALQGAVSRTTNSGKGCNGGTCQFANNTTTGNLVVVYVWNNFQASGLGCYTNTGPGTCTITMPSNSAAAFACGSISATKPPFAVWYFKNITGGTTPTVTFGGTSANNVFSQMAIIEYAGADVTTPIGLCQESDTLTAGTTTFTMTPSISASNGSAVEFAALITSSGSLTFTAGSGYTVALTQDNGGLATSMSVEDQLTTGGTYPLTITLSTATGGTNMGIGLLIGTPFAASVSSLFPIVIP